MEGGRGGGGGRGEGGGGREGGGRGEGGGGGLRFKWKVTFSVPTVFFIRYTKRCGDPLSGNMRCKKITFIGV